MPGTPLSTNRGRSCPLPNATGRTSVIHCEDWYKTIALLASSRTPVLPNVPTAPEQGVPEAAIQGWYGLFFPNGSPSAIVRRMSDVAIQTMDTPSVLERFGSVGITAVPSEQRSPEYLAKSLPEQIERWAVLIKASGVSME
jgi:tripartite-type tricarboxylate transporter receptor subunit TctC